MGVTHACCCFPLRGSTLFILITSLINNYSILGLSFGAGVTFFIVNILAIYGLQKREPYLILPHIILYEFHVFFGFLIALFLIYTYCYEYDWWIQMALDTDMVHTIYKFHYRTAKGLTHTQWPLRKNSNNTDASTRGEDESSTLSSEDHSFLSNLLLGSIIIMMIYCALILHFLIVQFSYFRELVENRVVIVNNSVSTSESEQHNNFSSEGLATEPDSGERVLSWHPVPSFTLYAENI